MRSIVLFLTMSHCLFEVAGDDVLGERRSQLSDRSSRVAVVRCCLFSVANRLLRRSVAVFQVSLSGFLVAQ